jgi:hypothetical protein
MFDACKYFGDKCLIFGGRKDDAFQTWGVNIGQHYLRCDII